MWKAFVPTCDRPECSAELFESCEPIAQCAVASEVHLALPCCGGSDDELGFEPPPSGSVIRTFDLRIGQRRLFAWSWWGRAGVRSHGVGIRPQLVAMSATLRPSTVQSSDEETAPSASGSCSPPTVSSLSFEAACRNAAAVVVLSLARRVWNLIAHVNLIASRPPTVGDIEQDRHTTMWSDHNSIPSMGQCLSRRRRRRQAPGQGGARPKLQSPPRVTVYDGLWSRRRSAPCSRICGVLVRTAARHAAQTSVMTVSDAG